MKKLVILVIILISAAEIIAQDPSIVIPPSPDAAGLAKYGQIPVDKAHGIPNINIPLYTISEDDISVPISISFHASGYKPQEMSGWIGHGWSLNAGGTISRNMKGYADENGFFYNIRKIIDYKNKELLSVLTQSTVNASTAHQNAKADLYDILENKDYQPDFFSYNYPGGAGKFMFNPDQTISTFPYNDLKIEPDINNSAFGTINGGSLSSFTINNINGLAYDFKIREETSTSVITLPTSDPHIYTSAWHLSTIRSKISGTEISFSYYSADNIIQLPLRTERNTCVVTSGDLGEDCTQSSSQNKISVQSRYLENISWPKGEIYFYKSDGRTDVQGGQQLDSIEVINNLGQLIKKYKFEYGYTEFDTHLRLLRLTEVNRNGETLPPYEFIYYPGVPPEDTKAIDHYGYYNGKDFNSYLTPYIARNTQEDLPLADREVHKDEAIVGMIKTIYYPMGGHTTFEYESNTYFNPDYSYVNYISAGMKCDSDGSIGEFHDGKKYEGIVCDPVGEESFSIPSGTSTKDGYHLEVTSTKMSGAVIGSTDFNVTITKDGVEVLNEYIRNGSPHYFSLDKIIDPGHLYVLTTETKLEGSSLTAKFYFEKKVVKNIPTAGIRVSRISSDARDINYNYNYESNTAQSSGILLAREPNYEYDYQYDPGPAGEGVSHYKITEASPQGLLGRFHSSPIIYREVEEYEIGNGAKRYYFSFIPQLEPIGLGKPRHWEPVSIFWKQGNDLGYKILDKDGNELIKKENFYTHIDIDTSKSFVFENHVQTSSINRRIANYAFEEQISGWARLDRTETKEYLKLNKIIRYEYIDGLILPTKTKLKLNSGLDKTVFTSYMDDRTMHIISPKTSEVTENNSNEILDRRINTYYPNFKLDTEKLLSANNEEIKTIKYKYNTGLKISEMNTRQNPDVKFIWGYNSTYPVLKVSNPPSDLDVIVQNSSVLPSGFSSLETLLNNLGNITFDSNQQKNWKIFNDNLRNHPNMSFSMVQSYTYQPLVGMTSQTDQGGLISYYEYDGFNRLSHIKDSQGNIIKKFDYNITNDKKEDAEGGNDGDNNNTDPTYTISAIRSGHSGGSISPVNASVQEGEAVTFVISHSCEPDANRIKSLLIDGNAFSNNMTLLDGSKVTKSGNKYTFTNIKSNHNISVEYEATNYLPLGEIISSECFTPPNADGHNKKRTEANGCGEETTYIYYDSECEGFDPIGL